MNENIQYGFRTRDGQIHAINVRGAENITEAVFEVAARLMKDGRIETDDGIYKVDDIVEYTDIPG